MNDKPRDQAAAVTRLSASSLFHFTKSPDTVANIIRTGFRPNYSCEHHLFRSRELTMYVPMVCFCDIRLSQLGDFRNRYGSCGIGLSKEWGLKKGLNPVLYLQRDSLIYNFLRRLLGEKTNGKPFKLRRQLSLDELDWNAASESELAVPSTEAEALAASLKPMIEVIGKPVIAPTSEREAIVFELLKYSKNYLDDAGMPFYDEREWRFVQPDYPLLNYLLSYNSAELASWNKQLAHHPILFTPEDVRYLFVSSSHECIQLTKGIEKIRRLTAGDRDDLISKIIVWEFLEQDI